jgi:2-polyprenyl-3-methyl-5-hydroxy-6-metoxy-1,4-benzoquinol methylase
MICICPICKSDNAEIIADYSALPRVTSDCKPWPAGGTLALCGNCGMTWKIADSRFEEEAAKIYAQYDIYALSQGMEQKVYAEDGSAVPRSRRLVDFILAHGKPGKTGKLIDIGCGNGEALGTFSRSLPGWELHGSELSDKHVDKLRRIPNFKKLHNGPLSEINEQFDIVSMIHVLEHIPDVDGFLRDVTRLLKPGGHLLIEVPNVVTSPFDLLIADHLSHYSPEHLAAQARRAGLHVVMLRDDVCPKEITLLTTLGSDPTAGTAKRDPGQVRRHIAWLSHTLEAARAAVADGRQIGIFGTSIAGMWLYGALSKNVAFFVDEDASRIGGQYEGRPILAPSGIAEGATVFIPLVRQTARNISERLSGSRNINWVIPPEV